MSNPATKYEKRLQQLEEFRQRKALEKSARADRIKRRVQELQDKRRQTIAQIRSDIGINYGSKNATRTSNTEQSQEKFGTAVKKSLISKASCMRAKAAPVQAKEKALPLKEAVNKIAGESHTSGVLDNVDSKPVNSRRLTMTLSESFIQSSLLKADLVEQKENKILSQKPQQHKILHGAKVGYKKDSQPFSAATANARVSSVAAAKSKSGVVPTRTSVPTKRVPVGTTEGPVVKKAKTDEPQRNKDVEKHSNAEPQEAKSLTREEQLELWRQQRRQKMLNEQNKNTVQGDRRKTMPSMTKVDAPNRARSAANLRGGNVSLAVDRLNVTRRVTQIENRLRHTVAKPVAKSVVSVIREPNTAIVQRRVKTVKIDEHRGPRMTSGANPSQSSRLLDISDNRPTVSKARASLAVRRSSLARKPVVKPLNEHQKGIMRTTKSNQPAAAVRPARSIATAAGPQMSTPYSHRRTTSSVANVGMQTPSFSCIPRRKTVAFLTPSSAKRTPKTQQTPGFTEEMCLREKLNKWLAAKGKTPSRYRHLMCFGVHGHGHQHGQLTVDATPGSNRRKSNVQDEVVVKELDLDMSVNVVDSSTAAVHVDSEEEVKRATEQITDIIKECLIVLRAGFPPVHLMTWLNEFTASLPIAKQLPSFWIFKAEVAMKANNDDSRAALQILDEAATLGIQPTHEVTHARLVFERLLEKQKDVSHNTSHRLAAEVQPENVFNSSAVKLCLRRVKDPVTPLMTVATPVRRSTRKSCTGLPPALRDHDVIVESADEIAPELGSKMTFKENVALNLEWHFADSQ